MRFVSFFLFCIFFVCGCATAQRGQHGLSYDFFEEPNYELVDFDYGGIQHAVIRGPLVAQKMGWWHNGPPGQYLWVKWKDKRDGRVAEDRVDLKHLLPSSMAGMVLVFGVQDGRLELFLYNNRALGHPVGCPPYQPARKCNRIYQQVSGG